MLQILEEKSWNINHKCIQLFRVNTFFGLYIFDFFYLYVIYVFQQSKYSECSTLKIFFSVMVYCEQTSFPNNNTSKIAF